MSLECAFLISIKKGNWEMEMSLGSPIIQDVKSILQFQWIVFLFFFVFVLLYHYLRSLILNEPPVKMLCYNAKISKQCRMAVSINTWQSITTAVDSFIKHLAFLSHIRVLLVIHGFQVSGSGPLEGFLTQLKQNQKRQQCTFFYVCCVCFCFTFG